jgi:hypothetical protein
MPKNEDHIKPRKSSEHKKLPILTQTKIHYQKHITEEPRAAIGPRSTNTTAAPDNINKTNTKTDDDEPSNSTHQSNANTEGKSIKQNKFPIKRTQDSKLPSDNHSGNLESNREVIEGKEFKTVGGHQPTLQLKRYSQIRLKASTTTNDIYGDDMTNSDDAETILFHNINGMKDEKNWYQIIATMKDLNVDIFGFAEINRSLHRGYNKNIWHETIRKIFYYSKTTHSESNIQFDSQYKPGGTITTITGKWQSRVTAQGQDSKGLGRWSYMRISSKKSSLIIATAYRPCVSQGPNTAWIQQWSILREAGDKNPDPIKYFYTDLEAQIKEWKKQGSEVLMMIDANEYIGEKPGGLTTLFGKLEMTDLLRHRHPNKEEPNTHVRGSKRIDYIFGTNKIRDNCIKVGILPFGTGYQSDHRAIFAAINIEKILASNVQAIDSITARKLQQATPKEREVFVHETHEYLKNNNVYQ